MNGNASSGESLVLVACAEPFASGGRALVFGSAACPVADELVERGARLVQVYDPDPERALSAAEKNRLRQVSIAPEADAEGTLKPGAFDVALVLDVTLFRSPASVLSLVRRALSSRGVAFVATPNAEAKTALFGARASPEGKTPLGYYELYDAVSSEFPEVTMLGQTPFVGYSVVDFAAEGDPDVSIDSELVPGGSDEPEWFVACASAEPVSLGAIHIVQLPATGLATSGPVPAAAALPRTDPKLEEELRAARAAEAHLIERVARLEVELARTEAELAIARAATLPMERGAELEREISLRDEQLSALRTELSTAEARARDAERLDSEKRELEAKLARKTAEIDVLTRAGEVDGSDETERLEGLLKEQGRHVRRLEADAAEAERVGKDLVSELEKLRRVTAEPSAPATGEGAGSPDPADLATENARLRADLEAASWSISELEGRLTAHS